MLHFLKAYKLSPMQSITVGGVGFHNIGKSGLINTFKQAKVQYVVVVMMFADAARPADRQLARCHI